METQPDNARDSAGGEPLRGKTAIVTGSSSGIGRRIVEHLAAAGAAVGVHGHRNREGAESLAAAIGEAGVESRWWLADLADAAACERLVEESWQWRGGIDIWINNAGVDVLTGTGATGSFDEKLQRLWRVDVLATVRLSRAVGGRMRDRVRAAGQPAGTAAIVNVGWDQAAQGMAGESGEMFATIKGAVMAFSRSLAQSLAPEVRVNCLAPGWIRTAWGEQTSAYWDARARREALLERWGTADDVARAACFLVSPAAQFVSGHVLPVNGGFRYGDPAPASPARRE